MTAAQVVRCLVQASRSKELDYISQLKMHVFGISFKIFLYCFILIFKAVHNPCRNVTK